MQVNKGKVGFVAFWPLRVMSQFASSIFHVIHERETQIAQLCSYLMLSSSFEDNFKQGIGLTRRFLLVPNSLIRQKSFQLRDKRLGRVRVTTEVIIGLDTFLSLVVRS